MGQKPSVNKIAWEVIYNSRFEVKERKKRKSKRPREEKRREASSEFTRP